MTRDFKTIYTVAARWTQIYIIVYIILQFEFCF